MITPARSQLRAVFYQTNTMPNTIYWTLVDSNQTPPETRGILSPSELEKFSTFRFPKRRDEWLLGRWTAKALAHSLPTYQHYRLEQIEILTTPQGAPYIQVPGKITPADCLTISHSEHLALCALTPGSDLHVGADLEKIEPRTETFILDYFTPAECLIVEAYPVEIRAVVVTLIWSAKEAMLKALRVGLRWDTRMVEVRSMDGLPQPGDAKGEWQRIEIGELKSNNRAWSAWWQRHDQFVLTLAGFAATQADIQSAHLVEKKL